MSLRFATLATLATLGVLVTLGCQTIAGVEDVSFSTSAQGSACDQYCDTLMEACPGDNAVYDDDATCRRVCDVFKAGNTSKPQGNTLACRAKQADIAFSLKDDLFENRSNCVAAGPGGGDTCTGHPDLPNCEGYCLLYTEACPSISREWGFDNLDQCIERCAAFPIGESYSVSQEPGDTIGCRIQQATLALEDPDNHCESAGLRPSGQCAGGGPPVCADYCTVNEVACQGPDKVYESRRQCEAVCDATRKGTRSDSGGQDTVGCRSYHSYFALMGQPVPHCSHSGPAGDGVCSDNGEEHPNCEAFCRLLKAGCADKFESVFANDQDACVEDCEQLDDAKMNQYSIEEAEKAENRGTLKCRLLHVARAVTDPKSPDAPDFCDGAVGESPCN